jgi:hypothetical protein
LHHLLTTIGIKLKETFAKGKLTYMLELKNKTVIIVPKRAFAQVSDQTIFYDHWHKAQSNLDISRFPADSFQTGNEQIDA